jgi:hypothetical protein
LVISNVKVTPRELQPDNNRDCNRIGSNFIVIITDGSNITKLKASSNSNCDASYPDVCIAPPPPDLNCDDIADKDFQVVPPDPHGFDREGDGIRCET